MPKIQDVGVGNFIRNPRKTEMSRGVRISSVLKIQSNEGNAFRCHSIKDIRSGTADIDTENYVFIPIDSYVEQVTI